MPKRLSAKRRRELWQRETVTRLTAAAEPTTQSPVGYVRNSNKAHVLNQIVPAVARANTPKPPMWEGSGKRGRVVRGKLVPPSKAKPWSAT